MYHYGVGVTVSELKAFLTHIDGKATLYESVDPQTQRISGIVVMDQYGDLPDIQRSQKLWAELRNKFKARSTTIGLLLVFTPTEWQRRGH